MPLWRGGYHRSLGLLPPPSDGGKKRSKAPIKPNCAQTPGQGSVVPPQASTSQAAAAAWARTAGGTLDPGWAYRLVLLAQTRVWRESATRTWAAVRARVPASTVLSLPSRLSELLRRMTPSQQARKTLPDGDSGSASARAAAPASPGRLRRRTASMCRPVRPPSTKCGPQSPERTVEGRPTL